MIWLLMKFLGGQFPKQKITLSANFQRELFSAFYFPGPLFGALCKSYRHRKFTQNQTVKNKFHAPENWLASIPQPPFPIKKVICLSFSFGNSLGSGDGIVKSSKEHCRDGTTFA